MAKLRVLVVDDSVVFRSQIKAALDDSSLVEVVGVANNGKIALEKLAQKSVDLVTLDMEMPEMGGLATLKAIRKMKFPARVIIFSSHTTKGSEAALEALSCGADDFVAKPALQSSEVDFHSAAERIKSDLLPKVLQFKQEYSASVIREKAASVLTMPAATFSQKDLDTFIPAAVVIGSSTGGPPALEKCLAGITKSPKLPIFIVQHMPPIFTASLAKRLQEITGVETAEGKAGELVRAGKIYVAPGEFHMILQRVNNEVRISLNQGPPRNSVRPAVDNLFESAAKVYGARCLGVVLTGMGDDGRAGCRTIKESGGGVMIQSKESCVVFGMPGAVFADGTFDGQGDIAQIHTVMKRIT